MRRICPNCKSSIDANSNKCPVCAKNSTSTQPPKTDPTNPATKQCKYCYSAIDKRATVCPDCQKPQSAQVGCMGLLLIGFILLAVVGAISFFSTITRFQSTAEKLKTINLNKTLKLKKSFSYLTTDKKTFADVSWVKYESNYVAIGFNPQKTQELIDKDNEAVKKSLALKGLPNIPSNETVNSDICGTCAGAALKANAETGEIVLIYAVDDQYKNWSMENNDPCIGWVIAQGGHGEKYGWITGQQGFGLPPIDRKPGEPIR